MNTLKLTTDQNVSIDVELASVGQRLIAVLLDTIILFAYFLIMFFILSMLFVSSFRFEQRWEGAVYKNNFV